jgi:hypothetical protein
VYGVVDASEAWDKTGKAPIGVRWVAVRKQESMYRNNLVAKDFAPKSNSNDIDGLYAAMPPLELVRVLRTRAFLQVGENIMFINIKKAHLYALIERVAYVDLSLERDIPGKCARLKFTLYGMRVVAKNWGEAYSSTMPECAFTQGNANATSFYHLERGVRVVLHGEYLVPTHGTRQGVSF